ncbi:permease [Candidatus Margulisiibacteriota bacterium]
MNLILGLLLAGLLAIKEYIALHVLTCLIPAFLLAGAIVTFISREAIIRHLGYRSSKLKSFTLAGLGSFFIAACSCTVIPVASGLYYGGSSIGPAFILLWVAPATNILALIYTGAVLGYQMALVRVVSALIMAFIVGLVMVTVFRKEEEERALKSAPKAGESLRIIGRPELVLIVLIVLSLLGPNYLVQKGPYLNKVIVWLAGMLAVFVFAYFTQSRAKIKSWLEETWWFVRIIFPLLLAGVFIVGVIGRLLPPELIRTWLGGSSLLASFLATLIGQLCYFATMTEAPFVDTLLKMGMGKGPALALLLTGPGMSLPNMLAIIRIFGLKKALVYIITIMVLGTLAGWFAGNFIF